jgi:hypothetical protein
MADNGTYEAYVEALRTSAGLQDETRITQGEIAAVIASEYGALKQAAIDAHIEYKALAQYKRVVEFYENSTRVEIGKSNARAVMSEYPNLRYTHLRVAMSLNDYQEAIDALGMANMGTMSIPEFQRWIAKLRRENGHKPSRYVIDNGRGLRVTIERYA